MPNPHLVARRFALALAALVATAAPLAAWDYEGHRIVNQLALAGLPADFPAFVRTPEAAERIAFLSGEMDRWRNSPDPTFLHSTTPDHYLDLEELPLVGLDPRTVPAFRNDFIVQFAAARAAHPEALGPIDPAKNRDHTREWPGFLPWAICEQFSRLQSECAYLKAFLQGGGTPAEIANAQANILYTMGVMGHLVGDAAQPLHTTRHHAGWVGANPDGYTTARTFHQWIDGGYIAKIGLSFAELRAQAQPAVLMATGPRENGRTVLFDSVMTFVSSVNARVPQLYQLEKAGGLTGEGETGLRGRAFIVEQLVGGGEFLASLWRTAWATAPADTYLLQKLQERAGAAAPIPPK